MAKKIKKYLVGTDSETYAISLVEMPAIEEDFIALSKEEEKMEVQLSNDEKHLLYGAVLVPDKDIYRNNGEQEFYINFTKESIEKMSQDFMKEYRQHEITVDHEETSNEVYVVESWIKADLFKDKSVALGLNEQLPVGTWFVAMKVNNIETWERIKSGELKGFSVESMISLEEFSKQNTENNMNIETNDMGFWSKMREILAEVFSKKESVNEVETELEEQVAEPISEPQPTVEEPQPTVEEPIVEPQPTEEPQPTAEEVTVEEPKAVESNSHLEELIKSLKDEINALKEMNNGLNNKVKELSKEPSAKPINTNAAPSATDTYSAWREVMRGYMG